jgi:hypothetical protein
MKMKEMLALILADLPQIFHDEFEVTWNEDQMRIAPKTYLANRYTQDNAAMRMIDIEGIYKDAIGSDLCGGAYIDVKDIREGRPTHTRWERLNWATGLIRAGIEDDKTVILDQYTAMVGYDAMMKRLSTCGLAYMQGDNGRKDYCNNCPAQLSCLELA